MAPRARNTNPTKKDAKKPPKKLTRQQREEKERYIVLSELTLSLIHI